MTTAQSSKLKEYWTWAKAVAAIRCEKAEVRQVGDHERGLFCTSPIQPGETILTVPADACLTTGRLRAQGGAAKATQKEKPETLEAWELLAMATIEHVRKFAIASTGAPLRDDDVLALFLASGKYLLMNKQEPNTNTSGESADNNSYVSFLPHAAMLPTCFPTHTLNYSDAELACIEGTNCHGYTLRMLQQIEDDFQQLRRVLIAYQIQTQRQPCEQCGKNDACECTSLRLDRIVCLDDYKWALCNIYSRCTDFHLALDGDETPVQRRLMVPVFDMINHQFDSPVHHEMDADGNVSLVYGSVDDTGYGPLQPGDEICFPYGNFPNEKLLLVYGFAMPDNPYDAVSLYAPLSPSDPLYSVKVRLLATCGITDTNAPHILRLKNTQETTVLPDSLLSVLRVTGIQSMDDVLTLAMQRQEQQDDADDENKVEVVSSSSIGMISTDNERGALGALHEAVSAMSRSLALNLAMSDTSGDASVAVGEARNNSLAAINIANANTLCQSEYTILQAILSELDERLDALANDSPSMPYPTTVG